MDKVKLKVFGLSYNSMSHTGAYALILAEENDAFRVPVIIGIAEAQSIAIQLEHLHSRRPLTHDLIKTIADSFGATLEEILIHHWESGIFHSRLYFRRGEEALVIDSRTSDAIALALRYNCPIYITPDVVAKTAIPLTTSDTIGKPPPPTVEELQQLLREAIANEDYESASRYRDLLNNKKNER